MTQITTPLPLHHTALTTGRTNRTGTAGVAAPGRLRRAITRLRIALRPTDRGGPLATPSAQALDSTGLRDRHR